MQRTFFYIPHSLLGVPVFGIGLLLLGLVLGLVIWAVRASRDPKRRFVDEFRQNGIVWMVMVVIVTVVLPMVEIQSIGGSPIGVAVRGYGVFLLLGVVSGVALGLWRAKRANIPSEQIFELAMWLFVGGIGGARLFYVIEYRDDFMMGSLPATIRKLLDFTRGGLVVYGSIIGGTLAMFGFIYRTWSLKKRSAEAGSKPVESLSTSFLRMGDVVIPCLFLGIFFGRLGCLMNGCCYGGRCEDQPWALHFPPGSPVYGDQLMSGELLGLTIEPSSSDEVLGQVTEVEKNSPAANRGLQVGDVVSRIYQSQPDPETIDAELSVDDTSQADVVAVVNNRPVVWSADEMPDRALAVSPSQVISSLSGLGICLILLVLSALFRLPDGMLMATGFAIYAVARYGEEMIRSDEPGQFGTNLSISQWISVAILPVAIAAMFYSYRRVTPK